MGRFIAGLALASVISLALPFRAAAAVGYVSFSPESAASGQTVSVTVDSMNCSTVDAGPATLRMVLSGPNDGPGAPSDHDIALKRSGGKHDGTYTFVVPNLDTGGYDVSIACFPDGGLLGMVPVDGRGFRVLPSGSASPASPAAPASSTEVVSTIVAIAVALESLLSGLH